MSEAAVLTEPTINLSADRRASPVVSANARAGVAMLTMATFFDALKRQDLSELEGKRLAYAKVKKIGGGVLLGLSIKLGVPAYLVDALSSGPQDR